MLEAEASKRDLGGSSNWGYVLPYGVFVGGLL